MEEAFQLALDSLPFLLKGAYYTVVLSLGGMFFGLVMGFGLALMRLSRFKLVSWLARIYVSFFRGTPLLVQLFVIYYGLPQLGMELDPLPIWVARKSAWAWAPTTSSGSKPTCRPLTCALMKMIRLNSRTCVSAASTPS